MKTYKRELAVILLIWLAYVVEVKDTSLVEILVWPVFAFLGASFGLDSYSKQLQRPPEAPDRRRPQRSGEYTGGEAGGPDDR